MLNSDILSLYDTLKEQCGELSREHLERLYVFALMWCTGALLELNDRRKMEIWLRGNDSIHLNLPDIPPDSEDTMFDYYVTADGTHALITFPSTIDAKEFQSWLLMRIGIISHDICLLILYIQTKLNCGTNHTVTFCSSLYHRLSF